MEWFSVLEGVSFLPTGERELMLLFGQGDTCVGLALSGGGSCGFAAGGGGCLFSAGDWDLRFSAVGPEGHQGSGERDRLASSEKVDFLLPVGEKDCLAFAGERHRLAFTEDTLDGKVFLEVMG